MVLYIFSLKLPFDNPFLNAQSWEVTVKPLLSNNYIKYLYDKTPLPVTEIIQGYFKNSDIMSRQKRFKNKTICIYSGSSASWQGIEDFYTVFSLILNKIPTTHFKILTYQLEVFLNNLPKDYKLAERLIVKKVEPWNVKSELINATFGVILRKSDVVSRVSAPIKFAEYLAAGLPVMLREGIGDTEQIIKKYNVGVIIKNNEYECAISELKILLDDKEVHDRCLNIAEKEFNIDISFKQYQEIYDNL